MHVIWQAEEAACCQSLQGFQAPVPANQGQGWGWGEQPHPRGFGLVCEHDACTESLAPAGASRGVSGCAAPGTVSKPGGSHGERYRGSRNQHRAVPTGASRAQHDTVSPGSRDQEQEQEQDQECWLVLKLEPSPQAAVLPQLLKPSSPSPERGCREVSSILHCGSDRRVGG